jgi:hypothetical protein
MILIMIIQKEKAIFENFNIIIYNLIKLYIYIIKIILMKNHLIYFILLSVIFLIEFAFNLNFYVTYKSDVCIT